MSNTELAQQIAVDLFTTCGDEPTKAKQLRMYTDFGDGGKYLAGWSEDGAASQIEKTLNAAGLIPRQAVAEALAALREGYTLRADGEGASIPWRAATDLARQELDATIAKLGLAQKENE